MFHFFKEVVQMNCIYKAFRVFLQTSHLSGTGLGERWLAVVERRGEAAY